MDGYAWLFAMLVTGMGALVVLYARYYMSPADPVPRFFSFLLAFMGAMLGIVLSGNLIQLVIFWELTSFTSFMLIAYWYHLADARRGASMALTVTAAGGLCLLAGVLMLGKIVGSYDLDRGARRRRANQGRRLVSRDHRAGCAGRADQERAVSFPLLAAAGHGGTHTGLRVPALGDHGESGRLPARTALAGALRNRGVVLDRRRRRASPRCCSVPTSRSSNAT